MIEGKTSTGFVYKIHDDVLDDMELLDALVDMDNGDMSSYRYAIKALLGEEQRKALYEHVRDKKTGRVSAKKVFEAFAEVLNSAKENQAIKNS
jgi:hypothetical protein